MDWFAGIGLAVIHCVKQLGAKPVSLEACQRAYSASHIW